MTRYNTIEKKQLVLDQLTWDTGVDPEGIDVQILDDNVILEGSVPSYQAKIAAGKTIQSIPGIRKITNNLRIKLPPNTVPQSDDEIHENVVNQLNKNEFVDTRDVSIKVENSTVIFEGNVKSLKNKHLLTDIAYSSTGVVDVINNTYVHPAKELSDEDIAGSIRIKLEERSLIDNDQFIVEVEDSVVHLRGNAPSWRVKEDVHEIALNTRSVTDVIDDIEIDQLPTDDEYRE